MLWTRCSRAARTVDANWPVAPEVCGQGTNKKKWNWLAAALDDFVLWLQYCKKSAVRVCVSSPSLCARPVAGGQLVASGTATVLPCRPNMGCRHCQSFFFFSSQLQCKKGLERWHGWMNVQYIPHFRHFSGTRRVSQVPLSRFGSQVCSQIVVVATFLTSRNGEKRRHTSFES